MIAETITAPPINTLKGGISFKNSQTHKGPQRVSISIKRPTVADAVVLDPIKEIGETEIQVILYEDIKAILHLEITKKT